MKRALIIVDTQPDFCEGGRLPVKGGHAVASNISTFMEDYAGNYDMIVSSQDWHVDPGDHWSDMPDYQTSFPDHCPAGDPASELHPLLDTGYISHRVKKGQSSAAFSAFEGVDADDVSLDKLLNANGITDVDVCGLAADYCVKATALGAARRGFHVRALMSLTAAVGGEKAIVETEQELRVMGVEIVEKVSA